MATREVARGEVGTVDRRTALVRRLDTLAYLLDDSIPIPGTGTRVGLDALIGLIPGVGDAAGALLSCYIVLQAARLGAGFAVILRMLLNIGIETVVGAIPLLGDFFDAGWKANDRNMRLLHKVVDAPGAARRTSWIFVAVVFLLLAAVFAGVIALIWWLFTTLPQPQSW
ncbi:MAG TPA: DUF4112 domain-containing protein [Longimicrobiaceae bacterium]